ncbi:17-beta-hydroxysteroid dehydrogenase 13-like isoform X2 [Oratosquilla oratoria]|uniref:17-beta-hydroxysteroid dehydrogenase 13-like isoform X2 n=1 Tax=Oratosquilla oratoria TaxID=337810 RepID=UPI003F7697C9
MKEPNNQSRSTGHKSSTPSSLLLLPFVPELNMTPKDLGMLVLQILMLQLKATLLLVIDIYRFFFPPELKSLKGELVLVTGAGQNLGRELALHLAKQGARLILWDVNQAENEKTAEMIQAMGAEAHIYTCDVSDLESVSAIANKVRQDIGHPGMVFNNAGVFEHKSFLSHTSSEIKKMVNVNLLGNIWVTREFLGHMIQRNRGHVVSISSVLGYMGRSQVVPYCASKFGVKGMTEALAEELRLERRTGVRVTAVHPFLISNVNEVQIENKLPWLFEVLSPDEAAARIVKGVRLNEEEIFLPEKLKPLMVFSKILPRKLRRLYADFVEH